MQLPPPTLEQQCMVDTWLDVHRHTYKWQRALPASYTDGLGPHVQHAAAAYISFQKSTREDPISYKSSRVRELMLRKFMPPTPTHLESAVTLQLIGEEEGPEWMKAVF